MRSLTDFLNESLVNEWSPAPATAAYLLMKQSKEEAERRKRADNSSTISEESKEIFVIIKPDSIGDKREIIASIEAADFKLDKEKTTKLSKSDVKKIFSKVGQTSIQTQDYLSSDKTVGMLFIETKIHGNNLQKVVDRFTSRLNDLYGIDDEVKSAIFVTTDKDEIDICKTIYLL